MDTLTALGVMCNVYGVCTIYPEFLIIMDKQLGFVFHRVCFNLECFVDCVLTSPGPESPNPQAPKPGDWGCHYNAVPYIGIVPIDPQSSFYLITRQNHDPSFILKPGHVQELGASETCCGQAELNTANAPAELSIIRT